MMKAIKASVIVPVYNGIRYIDQFCKCIVNQDCSDFEVIFIDDGSTDGSDKKLDEIKKSLNIKVRVIHQSNKGVSYARNVGIAHSCGEIICFCDIDDLISNDYISCFIGIMRNPEIDVATCNMRCTINKLRHSDYSKINYMTSIEALKAFLFMKLEVGVWGGAIRKDVIDSNNLSFAEGYKYNEDLHFMWQVFVCSRKIAVVNHKLYYYIWQEGSAMTKFENSRFDGYNLMKSLESFMISKKPDFSTLYCRFAAARIMWSITRQAASYFSSYSDFCSFFINYDVKTEMRKLLLYPKLLVIVSSFLYLCSPYLFYKIVGFYGKRTTHFK